jgi:hypothetical protein
MAQIMKNTNTLRKALSTGNGLSFGAWQMLPGTHLSRTIARCGFDWVLIDTEHGNIAGKPFRSAIISRIPLSAVQMMLCTSPYTPWPLLASRRLFVFQPMRVGW